MDALPDLLPMRSYLREMVWGGRKLGGLYGKDLPSNAAIGESFELSAYAGRESVVASGPLVGRGLTRLVLEFGAELLGKSVHDRHGGRFPLLIKLLDAHQDLSVQVHPDDAYAILHDLGETGKMEAWYVLQSEAGRVACGLRPGVDRQTFVGALASGRVEEVIRFHPVHPGDVVFIPPGTVHALCRGVVVYEVQQSSDVTFRIYDYQRRGLDGKPRELHVAQALEVIDFATETRGPTPWHRLPGAQTDGAMLVDCAHFQLHLRRTGGSHRNHAAGDAFVALTVVEGRATVSAATANAGAGSSCPLDPGGTLLVPSGREFVVAPRDALECTYLLASAGALPQ